MNKYVKILLILILIVSITLPMMAKNRALAIGMSLALPGSGNLYMGAKESSLYHFGAEALVLSGLLITNSYRNAYIDNALKYANLYAGSLIRRDKDYLTGLEWYITHEEYNESVRVDARNLYPDNLEQQRVYISKHSIADSLGWSWQSESNMNKFASFMENSRKIKFATWAIASGLIVNRIISVFITMPENRPISVEIVNIGEGIRGSIVYRFK